MSWYDLDSNVARVCTNKARIYSIKQGLSRFEHDLQNGFHTIVVQEVFHVYFNKFENAVTHSFLVILDKKLFPRVSLMSRNTTSSRK